MVWEKPFLEKGFSHLLCDDGKDTSELARDVDFSSDEDRSARLRARTYVRNRKPSHARSDVSARGSAKAHVLL